MRPPAAIPDPGRIAAALDPTTPPKAGRAVITAR
jgi:hypothetical protein